MILFCPECKARLSIDMEFKFVCTSCKTIYDIRPIGKINKVDKIENFGKAKK